MVFELTDELITYDPSDERLVIDCISNLLLGYYESSHMLMASPIVCSFFAQLITEDRAAKALYHLGNNNNIQPDVLWTIKIRLDNNLVDLSTELPISFFQKTKSIQPAILLCENLLDTKFYIRLCKEYHYHDNISIYGMMGGGQTTKDVFKSLRKERQIALTILDSDIRYPGCPIGGTAQKVSICNKNQLAFTGLYILNVHEIENLIPSDFLKEHCIKDAKKFIGRLLSKNLISYLRYYDIKYGMITKDVVATPGLKSYAEQLYDDLYPSSKGAFGGHLAICINNDKLAAKNQQALPGVFPAIKSSMLEDFLNSSSTISRADIFEPDRRYIADLIYTYACARGRDVIM